MQVHTPSKVVIAGRTLAYDEISPPDPKGTVLLLTGLAHITDARLILYPDTGHIPIIERADDYNRDVLAFLAS